ncbi:MAG TPA: hypothetical protein K8V56_10610 [Sporosarcina psychrophila]|uniref:Uncharacterized protein n=1 Tax=Sporosarcina psychrophila TaxID=1476 RepID=A0A921G1L6_SPOPS|nr:hypothetical protein [Sporosarcina psychrophila]
MGNINTVGYEKVRSFVLSSWVYLEVQTPTGTPVKRFSVSDGLIITGTANSTEIEYKVVCSGADASFTGKEIGKSVLFDVASGGQAIMEEVFTPFTLEQDNDELTVIHKLEVPKVI